VINTDGVSWGPSGDLSGEGVCRYARRVSAMLSGYARCSTDEPDLTGQRLVLLGLGVAEDRIYLVKGLTGTNRAGPAWSRSSRPCGPGTPLSWRSWTGSRARCPTPAASVTPSSPIGSGCRWAGRSTTGPTRWGGCSSSSWPPFAEFGVDPLRMRACGGMAVARAKGRLWGRQLKLSARRQARLAGLHAAGEHAVADLAGLFSVSWPAVCRVLERVGGRPAAGSGAEGRQHRG
jgi:hypothetical protein